MIYKYILVGKDGIEEDYEYDSYDEAVRDSNDQAVICRHYEYSDSDLVYTPDGSIIWPPKAKQ